MTNKRDNAYWLERLKRDAPDVYRDLQDGKHESVKAARTEAGMIRERTRLQELKNAYKKASPAEKEEFRRFIGCTPSGIAASTSSASATPAKAKLMTKDMKDAIEKVMRDRKMKMGAVMKELGFSGYDQSVSSAIARGTTVRDDVFLALEDWLERNAKSLSS